MYGPEGATSLQLQISLIKYIFPTYFKEPVTGIYILIISTLVNSVRQIAEVHAVSGMMGHL